MTVDTLSRSTRPLLAMTELSVGYRTRRSARIALAGIEVNVHRGEVVALVGENGAGKSTLLRTILGMQPPIAGEVRLDGAIVATLARRERARRVAVVLSDRLNPPTLRVEEVVALGRHPHTGWAAELSDVDRQIVANAISATAIDHLIGRRCGELSDGECQRVAIARALAQQPELLVVDEPTAFLDPKAKSRVMTLLSELTDAGSFAVIIASHDLDLVIPSAHQVWVAGDGRLVSGHVSEHIVQESLLAHLDAVVVVDGEKGRRVVSASRRLNSAPQRVRPYEHTPAG